MGATPEPPAAAPAVATAPALPQTPGLYLDKLTVICGPAKTGKSTIANHIRRLVAPRVRIVSATVGYDSRWNQAFLARIIREQEQQKENAPRDDQVRFLYEMCKTEEDSQRMQEIQAACTEAMAGLHAGDPLCDVIRKEFREVEDWHRKRVILASRESLKARDFILDLSALKNIELNPRQLLILDDCVANFQFEEFSQICRQAKSLGLTVVVCCQDDTDLPPKIRKAVTQWIYTSQEVAKVAVSRMKVPALIKRQVAVIAPDVFGAHYRRLVRVGPLFYHMPPIEKAY